MENIVKLNKLFEFFDVEWKPIYDKRLRKPLIYGKSKHNNKLGRNVFNSEVKTYKTIKNKKLIPKQYKCIIHNERDGHIIQNIFTLFGVFDVYLKTQPDISITLDYSMTCKFISLYNKLNKIK